MQGYDAMLSANYGCSNPGNGANAAMYSQMAQYHVPGSGLAYGPPPNSNVHNVGTQAGMTALNHAFSGLSVQEGPGANLVGMPAPALTLTGPQMQLMSGQGGLQQPQPFLVNGGILYARADIAPFACVQLPGNVPSAHARMVPRSMQAPGHAPFMENANYNPVTPQSRAFTMQGDFAGGDPPGFDERHVSIGSHSDGEHSSSPDTPDTVGASFGPSIAIARTDVSPAMQFAPGNGTPSPRHYLHTFEPAQIVKTMNFNKTTADLLAVTGASPPIPAAVPAVLGSRKTLQECYENPSGTTNVYIRGLHPHTTDDMLYAFTARFGQVANSKAMIDNQTGACKGSELVETKFSSNKSSNVSIDTGSPVFNLLKKPIIAFADSTSSDTKLASQGQVKRHPSAEPTRLMLPRSHSMLD